MLARFLKFMSDYVNVSCPICGNSNIERKDGTWYCQDCQSVW